MKQEDASQNREAKEVYGRGTGKKARGKEDRDRNVGVPTQRLRDKEKTRRVVSWPQKGYVGEIPHPIYDKDDAFKNRVCHAAMPNNYEELNTKIWAVVPEEIHTFFFRKVFAGDRGRKQELVNLLLTSLYNHCIQVGVPAEWNPEMGNKILALAKNAQFNEPNTNRPTKFRRTTRKPSKSTPQPTPSGDELRPAN